MGLQNKVQSWWVFRHKARLVVRGFAQVAWVDYGDTFALVARHDTIWLLLTLVGQKQWKMYHLDVKSAFLSGILHEDIYVQQPKGFVVSGHEHKVYKLSRPFMAWNKHLEPGIVGLILILSS